VIVGDDGTSNPYKIQFKDGKLGGDFYKADVEVKLDDPLHDAVELPEMIDRIMELEAVPSYI
jgi:hypothetical protein